MGAAWPRRSGFSSAPSSPAGAGPSHELLGRPSLELPGRPSWSELADATAAQNPRCSRTVPSRCTHHSFQQVLVSHPFQVCTNHPSGDKNHCVTCLHHSTDCGQWRCHVHDCEGERHQISVVHFNHWDRGSEHPQLVPARCSIRRLEISCPPMETMGYVLTIPWECQQHLCHCPQ